MPRFVFERTERVIRSGKSATIAANSVLLSVKKPSMLSRSRSKAGPMQVVGRPKMGSVPLVQLLAAKGDVLLRPVVELDGIVLFSGRVALRPEVELELGIVLFTSGKVVLKPEVESELGAVPLKKPEVEFEMGAVPLKEPVLLLEAAMDEKIDDSDETTEDNASVVVLVMGGVVMVAEVPVAPYGKPVLVPLPYGY